MWQFMHCDGRDRAGERVLQRMAGLVLVDGGVDRLALCPSRPNWA